MQANPSFFNLPRMKFSLSLTHTHTHKHTDRHSTPPAVADWVAEIREADTVGHVKLEGLDKTFELVMVHRDHINANSLPLLLTGIS